MSSGYIWFGAVAGYKQSGLGTEGGMEGLQEYTEIKSVATNFGNNRPANFMAGSPARPKL